MECYTCFGCGTKTEVVRIIGFFKESRSVTSTESTCRVLFNDMAEHRPILKNNENTSFLVLNQTFYIQKRYRTPYNRFLVFTVFCVARRKGKTHDEENATRECNVQASHKKYLV